MGLFVVQLEQSGSRTPHCTFMGHITKPDNSLVVKVRNLLIWWMHK